MRIGVPAALYRRGAARQPHSRNAARRADCSRQSIGFLTRGCRVPSPSMGLPADADPGRDRGPRRFRGERGMNGVPSRWLALSFALAAGAAWPPFGQGPAPAAAEEATAEPPKPKTLW